MASSLSYANEKEYVIGVEAVSYAPLFDFSVGDTSKPSYAKALLSSFFEHKGYKFKFLPLPIKRFDKWFIEENIDFKFPDNLRWRSTQSADLDITYSIPTIQLVAGTYVLKKNKDMAREQVKSLGTIFGFYPTLWYDKLSTGEVELREEDSPFSVVKHLVHGNIDATNIDYNVIMQNLERLGLQNDRVVLNQPIHHETYAYHLSSIKYPQIIKEFNQFLIENPELILNLKKQFNIKEPIEH